jgi:outer membrane protein with beta-barrel domain
MKKIFFLALCLLAAGSVSAQGYYYGPHKAKRPSRNQNDFYKIKFGIAGGVNIANTINSYSYYGTGSVTSFHAGVIADIPIDFPVSFTPEVLYSEKGYTAAATNGIFTQHSNYIDVPLLFKFRLAPNFNFSTGPQVSFLLSSPNYNNGVPPGQQQYYNNNYNSTDVGAVFGLSFDIGPHVELRTRYAIDFRPYYYYYNYYGSEFRNQVWQFGLGFKFW